jgi:hypothetical protein
MRHKRNTTHLLSGLPGIQSHVYVKFDCLIELGTRRLLYQLLLLQEFIPCVSTSFADS